jgi:hypothetical protein
MLGSRAYTEGTGTWDRGSPYQDQDRATNARHSDYDDLPLGHPHVSGAAPRVKIKAASSQPDPSGSGGDDLLSA